LKVRLIPRLDIKGGNLVKGINLEGLRIIGKPEVFAKLYSDSGADELIYIDSVASLYGRKHLLEIVRRTSNEIFIPLCAGGGIRSPEDANEILRSGADKISINSEAVRKPKLITELSELFGSSTVVSYISAKKREKGYEVYIDNGRERTGICPIEWAQEVESLGAGELLIESIDQEGTGLGFDLELAEKISSKTNVPIIITGGFGKVSHIEKAFEKNINAFAIGSMFHFFHMQKHAHLNERKEQSHYQFQTSHFENLGIEELKQNLSKYGVPIREVTQS
jgi:imidazole glycerol-phosphate synthase subunit HisF